MERWAFATTVRDPKAQALVTGYEPERDPVYPHLEIHTRCLRDTKNDQLWSAFAEHKGRVGPTVFATSRKKVRTKARTAFPSQEDL